MILNIYLWHTLLFGAVYKREGTYSFSFPVNLKSAVSTKFNINIKSTNADKLSKAPNV